ncbi:MAG: NAD-dependent epimerase/dehydratase family protein [Chromatiales bacterium]|nr:NAD-dependent epimerase/dehydratase family protein [Chromatiales bacterium]
MMKLLLTGANGFIARNLQVALSERGGCDVLPVTRDTDDATLNDAIAQADAVIHLAGVNRPHDPNDFVTGNRDFTARLCARLADTGRAVPIAFASSIQVDRDTPYGQSKRAAEAHLLAYADTTDAPVALYRLPNVFGKWCRPNYNSAVATFCHNIARGLPIRIDDPASVVQLVYIDDVVAELLRWLDAPETRTGFPEVAPVYTATVGELAEQIRAFGQVRDSLITEAVGTGLVRALYATYISALPADAFSYPLPRHGDARGVFVEMLKTRDSGQVSFFTAHPGVTRGGHYHHTKTEKFLVVKGQARFRFRHILTDETHTLDTQGDDPRIVETIPGWAHDITNIGTDEMIVLLWANEIFDRARPDTVACPVA